MRQVKQRCRRVNGGGGGERRRAECDDKGARRAERRASTERLERVDVGAQRDKDDAIDLAQRGQLGGGKVRRRDAILLALARRRRVGEVDARAERAPTVDDKTACDEARACQRREREADGPLSITYRTSSNDAPNVGGHS